MLVKSLAKAIQSDYKRVQFTPDLLPNDILGVSIFNSENQQFEFRPGPIFTSVLLADEIKSHNTSYTSSIIGSNV